MTVRDRDQLERPIGKERSIDPVSSSVDTNSEKNDSTSVSSSAVRSWYMGLRCKHAVTADDAYRLLRAILNTAVTDGLIIKSPCQVKGAGQVRSPERPTATLVEVPAAVAEILSAID